jgi:hypothetical protein
MNGKNVLVIRRVENGFLVALFPEWGMTSQDREWIASSHRELADLIEKLAGELPEPTVAR